LRHLADRVATRLRAKSRSGRTVTVRVRFADLRSVTRSVTLEAPISATVSLAEIAEDLVRAALVDHPEEKTISLVAISVSHLESESDVQLDLPLGLEDEKRRPGTKTGMARWTAADFGADPHLRSGRNSAHVRRILGAQHWPNTCGKFAGPILDITDLPGHGADFRRNTEAFFPDHPPGSEGHLSPAMRWNTRRREALGLYGVILVDKKRR
jgi:hypothetical protein